MPWTSSLKQGRPQGANFSRRRKADDDAKSSNWRSVVLRVFCFCLDGSPPLAALSRFSNSLSAPTSSPTSESRTCFLFFCFEVEKKRERKKSEFFKVFFSPYPTLFLRFFFSFSLSLSPKTLTSPDALGALIPLY